MSFDYIIFIIMQLIFIDIEIVWLFCLIMTDKSDVIDGACSIWHWPFDYIITVHSRQAAAADV